MKPLTLLLCLFLLACEKRAVDPEIEKVRAWLLSEGQNEVAVALSEEALFNRVTIDQLIPCETWVIKGLANSSFYFAGPLHPSFLVEKSGCELYALYAEEKIGDRGNLLIVEMHEGRVGFDPKGFYPKGFSLTKS